MIIGWKALGLPISMFISSLLLFEVPDVAVGLMLGPERALFLVLDGNNAGFVAIFRRGISVFRGF